MPSINSKMSLQTFQRLAHPPLPLVVHGLAMNQQTTLLHQALIRPTANILLPLLIHLAPCLQSLVKMPLSKSISINTTTTAAPNPLTLPLKLPVQQTTLLPLQDLRQLPDQLPSLVQIHLLNLCLKSLNITAITTTHISIISRRRIPYFTI